MKRLRQVEPGRKSREPELAHDQPTGDRHWRLGMLAATMALAIVAGGLALDYWIGIPEGAKATYVGGKSCAQCHQKQASEWQGSHHDLAMDLATPQTVLASFDGQELEHHGVKSRMFQRDGKYFVNTDGPDGNLADFEVKYVFGVEPLQQYMVELERPADAAKDEIGRVQVLRETWDTKRNRWFYQSPPDVQERLEPDDELHWTGITQRWNTSCADCHSTNLQKNFDLESRTYHTTFTDIDVSCEACHGPGSLHVQLARGISPFWDRKRGYALARLKGESNLPQIEACAPCHSRRSAISGGYDAGKPYHDFFANEVLAGGIYHADGQILDEDYEYGSFTQSKMFHKGVRCSDCHNPHSTKLKLEGNQLCTSCHIAHPAGKYDSPAHHHHQAGSRGALCVECHMPATTYMDVDPRRDHSLRIPRPDLSVQLGTPNACTGCHLKDTKLSADKRPKSPTPNRPVEYADWLRAAGRNDRVVKDELARLDKWSDDAVEKWYGSARKKEPHFAEALVAARKQAPDAEKRLIALLENRTAPAIARATAARELGHYVEPYEDYSAATIAALRTALKDRDEQVRAAAAISLQNAPDKEVRAALIPMLSDKSRIVRSPAVRTLARFPRDEFLSADYRIYEATRKDFDAAERIHDDRAEAHLMRGDLLAGERRLAQARQEYLLAIDLAPNLWPPRQNLANVLDQLAEAAQRRARSSLQTGDRAGAEQELEKMTELLAQSSRVRFEELALVERAATQVPGDAFVQRRLGLLRHLMGWRKEAEAAILRAHLLEPRTPVYLQTLAIYYRDTGRAEEAVPLVVRLLELRPGHPEYRQMQAELRSALGK